MPNTPAQPAGSPFAMQVDAGRYHYSGALEFTPDAFNHSSYFLDVILDDTPVAPAGPGAHRPGHTVGRPGHRGARGPGAPSGRAGAVELLP